MAAHASFSQVLRLIKSKITIDRYHDCHSYNSELRLFFSSSSSFFLSYCCLLNFYRPGSFHRKGNHHHHHHRPSKSPQDGKTQWERRRLLFIRHPSSSAGSLKTKTFDSSSKPRVMKEVENCPESDDMKHKVDLLSVMFHWTTPRAVNGIMTIL